VEGGENGTKLAEQNCSAGHQPLDFLRFRKIESASGATRKDAVMYLEGNAMQQDVGKSTHAQLKSVVERIERLEEEKKALSGDIKDVYSEAKANGFDTKALRKVVQLRKQDQSQRREEEAILATYMAALGMIEA